MRQPRGPPGGQRLRQVQARGRRREGRQRPQQPMVWRYVGYRVQCTKNEAFSKNYRRRVFSSLL